MAASNGDSRVAVSQPLSNGLRNGHSNGHAAAESLRVLIVGAGIGGLTAANFLRQNGHQVTLLEQSRFASEVGAAVHVAPNANGLLRRLGIAAEDMGANVFAHITEYNTKSEKVRDFPLEQAHSIWQHPWHLVHRVRLHEELKNKATSPAGSGTPVVLKTSSRVSDVDPAQGVVTLENGDVYKGDVVIGADGVHSKTRAKVAGTDIRPHPSGQSAFRFLVSREIAQTDDRTAAFAQIPGQLTIWYGADRRVVMYPCNDNKLLNFVCIHPRTESDPGLVEDWDSKTNKSALLKVYEKFDPNLLALLDKAEPESLRVWELLNMEELPTWTSDRLALLGDSAHPFLPHQGQGAAMAIEDAAALGVVLPLGTHADQVPERLRLYEQFRHERATAIQQFSRVAGRDNVDKDFDMMGYTNYNCGHDEWDSATDKFRRWQWAQNPNLYWRMPVSFGPFPGPRQTVDGTPRTATHSTFTTASIKFKTSRTVLQSLFPTKSFRFKSSGTFAYASFSQSTLNKMEWLGGSGYRHIGLYIHGVQYVQKDGTVRDGTFLPILFENLTDPIVSGREELGMPKLHCTVDIWRRSSSYRIQTGWQGVQFGSLSLEGLAEVDPAASKGTIGGEDDQGLFAYKYIPKVGERGQADVEHATFVPHAEEAKVVPSKVLRVFEAKAGSVKFDPLDWESLPTLHHVISRLAEIPIYEVVGGKVVEGVGVPDVSSARRID